MHKDRISAYCFIALLVLFGASAVYTTVQHKLVQKLGQKDYGIINSELFATFEKEFKDAVPYNDPLNHGWGALNYGVFHSGKSGVVIGEEEWLFTKEEFEDVNGFDANLARNLQFISHAVQQLQEAGIEVIAVPIPSKARVYSEKLGGLNLPHYRAHLYDQLIWHFNNHAMYHVNLEELFALYKGEDDEQMFMRTDTHWSQHGAQATAQLIESYFREGLTYSMDFESTPTEVNITDAAEEYRGDLTEFISTGNWHKSVGPKSEILHKVSVEKASSGGDLFGDVQLPIALVGTSYSAEPEWHFADFLADEFDAEVWNLADPGEGPFTPMQRFLKERQWEGKGVKLVLWEIPERFLPVAYELDFAKAEGESCH